MDYFQIIPTDLFEIIVSYLEEPADVNSVLERYPYQHLLNWSTVFHHRYGYYIQIYNLKQPKNFVKNKYLKYLNVQQLKILVPHLSKYSTDDILNMKELDIIHGYNQLVEIPKSIGILVNLKKLFIMYTRITKLPESIGNLINLEELYLSNNRLTELPDSIGNLTQLKILTVGNNELTKVPESIGNLTNLLNLNLSSNRLTELPASMGKLTNLKRSDLRNNKLTIDNVPNALRRIAYVGTF